MIVCPWWLEPSYTTAATLNGEAPVANASVLWNENAIGSPLSPVNWIEEPAVDNALSAVPMETEPPPPPPSTFTITEARLVTSYVLLVVIVCEPDTSSLADTVTAVPVFVLPVMYPVVLVTEGVTLILWLLTVPFVAVGVPAVPDGIAFIWTLDKPSYPVSGVIVCEDVVGFIFVLACKLLPPPLTLTTTLAKLVTS